MPKVIHDNLPYIIAIIVIGYITVTRTNILTPRSAFPQMQVCSICPVCHLDLRVVQVSKEGFPHEQV